MLKSLAQHRKQSSNRCDYKRVTGSTRFAKGRKNAEWKSRRSYGSPTRKACRFARGEFRIMPLADTCLRGLSPDFAGHILGLYGPSFGDPRLEARARWPGNNAVNCKRRLILSRLASPCNAVIPRLFSSKAPDIWNLSG